MTHISKRGCLSRLLFIAALIFFSYTVYSHFAKDATPVEWSDALTSLAWMLGLSVFFKLISPRPKRDTSPFANFDVEVRSVDHGLERGSNDISASARQIEYIKALGGTPKKNMTLSEASAMIDDLKIQHDIELREEKERRIAERKAAAHKFKTVEPKG